eukprot:gene10015-13471_t
MELNMTNIRNTGSGNDKSYDEESSKSTNRLTEINTEYRQFLKNELSYEQLGAFMDLVYVAVMSNIGGKIIHSCSSDAADVNVYLIAASFFMIMFTTRYIFDCFIIASLQNKLHHRFMSLAYYFGVFMMTININVTHVIVNHSTGHVSSPESENNFGSCFVSPFYLKRFAIGYTISRISLSLLYIEKVYSSYQKNENNKIHAYLLKIIPFFAFTIIFVVVAFTMDNFINILVIIALIELVWYLLIDSVTKYFNYSYEFNFEEFGYKLQLRLQYFFLIVLGEAFIGLLIAGPSTEETANLDKALIFAFILLFSLGTHFVVNVHRNFTGKRNEDDDENNGNTNHNDSKKDNCRESELVLPQYSTSNKNVLEKQLFIWLHPFVGFFVLVVTTAMLVIYEEIKLRKNKNVDINRKVMSIGLFVVVLLMKLMRSLHKGLINYIRKGSHLLHFMVCVMVSFAHLSVYWNKLSGENTIVIHSCIAAFASLFEMCSPFVSKKFGELFSNKNEIMKVMKRQTARIPSFPISKQNNNDINNNNNNSNYNDNNTEEVKNVIFD